MPRLKDEFLHTPSAWNCCPKPRLLVFVFSLSQRVHAGEGDHSEYALAHPTAQCINQVGALHKVNIARRKASNIEAHCLLSSVRLSCLAHCRSQFCAAHRKSLSLHLPPAAVELVSPNVPNPFWATLKTKQVKSLFSRFTAIHSRPTSGLLLCTAVKSYYPQLF